MKTILIGFKTADGKGPATLLAGPDVAPSEQAKQITRIKTSKVFPEGFVRVELCGLESQIVGIKLDGNNQPEEQPQPIKTEKKKK